VKVILQADVKNIGSKGEIVDVKEGYGRNYLIPRGLAVEATPGYLRQAAHQKKVEEARAEREVREARALEARLKDQVVAVTARVGEGGKLFGSVTTQEIADGLRKLFAVEIDKRKIDLKEPIKSLGTYSVLVKIHPQVHVPLKVKVVEG